MRGPAGEFPLDEQTIYTVGRSLARQFREKLGRTPRFITGRDTRESGAWIEKAFQAGAVAEGAHCESAEVITTPGVAFLTKAFEFDAGIVISASHNPFDDNGIKFFSATGVKLADDIEQSIEDQMDQPLACVSSGDLGKAWRVGDAAGRGGRGVGRGAR